MSNEKKDLAYAIGALDRIARVLLPGQEAPSADELVLAAAQATIERDEARAWAERTKPRLEAALARIRELETSPSPVTVPSKPRELGGEE